MESTVIDVAGEHGLSAFTRNRTEAAANGRQYGGVAIVSRTASTTFKPLELENSEDFEVMCVVGKISKIREKVVVVAAYIPPNYPRVRANECIDYISDVIAEAKRKHDSPLIIVGGDWNQWDLGPIKDEHVELVEVDHGPTRGDRKIDRFLVNFPRAVIESDVLPPLDDGLGRVSDHNIAYFRAGFRIVKEKSITYRYRHYTEQGAVLFQDWISQHNFGSVYASEDVNDQLEAFLRDLEGSMDICFPYRTTVRRERDPPWINPYVKQLIKRRRRIYHKEGRSDKWKSLLKKVKKLVRKRSKNYWDHQKKALLRGDASRVFFKNVKSYSSKERPPQFDVRTIFDQGLSDETVAERLADHFNGISCEFQGLDPSRVPETYSAPVQILTKEMVVNRLVQFKKPKSMVKHDIFPALVKSAAPYLAEPLTHIYNTITTTSTWPMK